MAGIGTLVADYVSNWWQEYNLEKKKMVAKGVLKCKDAYFLTSNKEKICHTHIFLQCGCLCSTGYTHPTLQCFICIEVLVHTKEDHNQFISKRFFLDKEKLILNTLSREALFGRSTE